MEYTMMEPGANETSIQIIDEATIEDEIFVETIELGQHDVDDATSVMVNDQPYEEDPLDLTPVDNITLRECYIQVERCDKIWETMKLIRELQEPTADSIIEESGDEEITEPPSPQQNPTLPYIKYQPVLSNGNAALPKFEFSVKSTRALYQCAICTRQYSQRQTLREHSEKAHNIIIPSMRKPAKTKVETTVTKTNSLDNPDEESNQGSNISICSSAPSVDKEERLLDSASDTPDSESLKAKAKQTADCKFCGRILSDRYYLKVHETLIHGVKTHFPNGSGPQFLHKRKRCTMCCNRCGKYFLSRANYTKHIRSRQCPEKQTQPTTSSSSNQRTRQRSAQVAETNVTTPKTRSLSLPGKKSKYLSTAKPCEICGKVWSSITNWKIHMIKAHGIRVNDSTVEQASSSNSLGNYSCEYCGKKFNWKTTLYNHVVLNHLNERMSLRNVKQKAATVKRAVASSLSSTNGRVNQCNKCSNTYLSMRSLKVHQAKVHGIIQTHIQRIRPGDSLKAFKCDVCPVRFQTQKSKAQHQMVYHGIRFDKPQTSPKKSIPKPEPVASRKTPVRSLRERGRVNYSEDNIAGAASRSRAQRSPVVITKRKSLETSIKTEPIPEPGNTEQMFQCILCGKHRKHIRKHFIEFHKVKHPDLLISQCQPSPPASQETPSTSVTEIKKENITDENVKNIHGNKTKKQKTIIKQEDNEIIMPPKKKRRAVDSMKTIKRLRVPGPHEAFELKVKVVKGGKRRFYCCKACEFMSLSYDSARKHVRLQHTPQQLDEAIKSSTNVDTNITTVQRPQRNDSSSSRNRRRDSMMSEVVQKRRLSSANLGDEFRLTRAVKRLRQELEYKCDNCERIFRNGDILSAHRSSCRLRCSDVTIDSNDTRESSDRDSGIGISITIKKKNDSYEIVSRDSSGERPRTGDGYSDASSDTRNSTTFVNEHQDVIQDEQKVAENFVKSDEIEKEAEDDDDDDGSVELEPEKVELGSVPSLKELCRRVLHPNGKIVKNKKKKKSCWSSNKKIKSNRKAKCEGSRVETLRELCAKVLIDNGDVDAASKISYPCHVCGTVWASSRARSIHAFSHNKK